MKTSKRAWIGLIASTAVAVSLIFGCGNNTTSVSDTKPETDATEDATTGDETESQVVAPLQEPARMGGSLVFKKGDKTWIGDVPLDVWYDDPLAVAATSGQVASPDLPLSNTNSPLPETSNSTPDPMPMPMETASAGGIDWKSVITGELLDAEVTSIRNRLNADLQTVGSFNSSYLSFPPHFAALAVLSHIAQNHPDDIRWKENAKYIRHLAGEMGAEPLRRGPSSQRPLKQKFGNVIEILNGSVPATLEAPPEDKPMSEVVKVRDIMKRLENASKFISINGGTADSMKENADALKQEAAVLGALTLVLLDGYEDYEDDEIFEGFVRNMVDASQGMREHIQAEQFDEFDLAVSKMTLACQQCHTNYK